MNAMLMCTTCRAETVLTESDGPAHSEATIFCAEHRATTTQISFDLLLPLPDRTPRLGDHLPTGTTMTDLIGHHGRLTIHPVLSDTSSLCGFARSGTLPAINNSRWSDVPLADRCQDCHAATRPLGRTAARSS